MFQQGGFGPIPGQVHHFLTVENELDRRYGGVRAFLREGGLSDEDLELAGRRLR